MLEDPLKYVRVFINLIINNPICYFSYLLIKELVALETKNRVLTDI